MVVYLLLSRKWKFIKPLAISIVLSLPLVYYPVVMITDYMEGQQLAENQTEQSNQEKVPE